MGLITDRRDRTLASGIVPFLLGLCEARSWVQIFSSGTTISLVESAQLGVIHRIIPLKVSGLDTPDRVPDCTSLSLHVYHFRLVLELLLLWFPLIGVDLWGEGWETFGMDGRWLTVVEGILGTLLVTSIRVVWLVIEDSANKAHVVLVLVFLYLSYRIVKFLVLSFCIQHGLWCFLVLIDSDNLVESILLVDSVFILEYAQRHSWTIPKSPVWATVHHLVS